MIKKISQRSPGSRGQKPKIAYADKACAMGDTKRFLFQGRSYAIHRRTLD